MNKSVEQFSNGYQPAFRQIVDDYQIYVRSIVAYMGVLRDDADDLAQEVFLYVFENIKKFEPGTNFKAWLRAITRNTVLSFMVRQKRKPHNLPEEMAVMLADRVESWECEYREKTMDNLDRCLQKLNPEWRQLIHDRYSGRALSDIASTMDRSVVAVKRLLLGIRRQLRECMEGDH